MWLLRGGGTGRGCLRAVTVDGREKREGEGCCCGGWTGGWEERRTWVDLLGKWLTARAGRSVAAERWPWSPVGRWRGKGSDGD
ncbi:hypothetical protein OIU74_002436 [Salix koriyanagi]|uniref:Uncharacterized protein n=1 Tax=Salix koriyanagi TaxID=2511006 RepID=A0A9Q1APA4_9ROSI|nr:hypothetical protein OIU74_002436 [Salix koriyanagi]